MYFVLLILGVWFNLTSNMIHKNSKLSETFWEKDLKLVLYEGSDHVTCNISLMLLPVELDLITEKQKYKKDAFIALSFSGLELFLALWIEIISFHV